MDKNSMSRGELREEADRQDAIKRAKQAIVQAKKSKKNSQKRPGRKTTKTLFTVHKWDQDPRDVLRVGDGFSVDNAPRDATPGWLGTKKEALDYLSRREGALSDLQERLYAASTGGASDAVLLILQGMDRSGKGDIIRHVLRLVDPRGVTFAAFKAPTPEEQQFNFLWRVTQRMPRPGFVGVFNRSHYEDVLIPIAQSISGHPDGHGHTWTVSAAELERRFHAIEKMERKATQVGIRIVKISLLVSFREQGRRLCERLDRPDQYWRFSPTDLATREDWGAYQEAYQQVMTQTSYDVAPWYAVPADKKWYARLAVTEILTRTLKDINPQWPNASFDVVHARDTLNQTLTPDAVSAWDHELLSGRPPSATPGQPNAIAVDALNR